MTVGMTLFQNFLLLLLLLIVVTCTNVAVIQYLKMGQATSLSIPSGKYIYCNLLIVYSMFGFKEQ